jgi:hypothetical protein
MKPLSTAITEKDATLISVLINAGADPEDFVAYVSQIERWWRRQETGMRE